MSRSELKFFVDTFFWGHTVWQIIHYLHTAKVHSLNSEKIF